MVQGTPFRKDDEGFCSGSESTSCYAVYEHNKCRALEVVGQHWSSAVVALFLEDWVLARVTLSCHVALDLFVPRNERSVPRMLSVTVFA